MNERRKQSAERGAHESMYVHSEQRRNFRSKPSHESRAFTLLPQRPQSCGDTRFYSRGSELRGLQVQGFCCTLQQRPSTGRSVTPQGGEGRDGSLTLISSLKGKLESRAKPASSSVTGRRAETVRHRRDPDSESTGTATPPCDRKRQALQGQPGATMLSELHLYLPTSLCDDDEQDAKTEGKRTSAKDTSSG